MSAGYRIVRERNLVLINPPPTYSSRGREDLWNEIDRVAPAFRTECPEGLVVFVSLAKSEKTTVRGILFGAGAGMHVGAMGTTRASSTARVGCWVRANGITVDLTVAALGAWFGPQHARLSAHVFFCREKQEAKAWLSQALRSGEERWSEAEIDAVVAKAAAA